MGLSEFLSSYPPAIKVMAIGFIGAVFGLLVLFLFFLYGSFSAKAGPKQ